jgi:hypothetical protein
MSTRLIVIAGKPNQIFKIVPVEAAARGLGLGGAKLYTIQQGELCVDNSFQP